ncbi:MAG: hypothetical protein HYX68_21410 [Planctomycetes bacterium]|nr:hypothetical protein [Planctomycetota bacterium]
MTLTFSAILLAAFGLSLILVTVSLRLLRGAAPAGEPSSAARFFMVALRVAIGWHCFVEGMEKLSAPGWSSETYLREAMGPCSGPYRWVAGDRLVERLTVEDDGAFPARLDREWRDYAGAFADYHGFTDEQRSRAIEIVDALEQDALGKLFAKTESVTKASEYPPDLTLDMNVKQRLEEHERLLGRVRDLEGKFPTADKAVHADWKTAKADLAKWRAGLKRSLDATTAKLTFDEADRNRLKARIKAQKDRLKITTEAPAIKKINETIAELTAELNLPSLLDVLTSDQKLKDPMPAPGTPPLRSWELLEVSDFLVKWSLIVLGACLMLGLLSRLSSLATALLILSFYLAMPPLPGWPESPRLEGHYLLVNKTLIEILALMTLTFIPTGRWAGLDGLLCLCCQNRPKNDAVPS